MISIPDISGVKIFTKHCQAYKEVGVGVSKPQMSNTKSAEVTRAQKNVILDYHIKTTFDMLHTYTWTRTEFNGTGPGVIQL